jgi:hypothetical protein
MCRPMSQTTLAVKCLPDDRQELVDAYASEYVDYTS